MKIFELIKSIYKIITVIITVLILVLSKKRESYYH